MTPSEDGIPLFKSISPEQIGAVNLVLSCLHDGAREVEPTIRALLMRSGVSGGFVKPRDCLRLAIHLGLVHEERDEIKLSALGQELLGAASWPPYNLFTEKQGMLLLAELIQRPDFANPIASLLHRMQRRRDGSLELIPGSVALTYGETQCLQALQSMWAIHYSNGALLMTRATYDALLDVLGPSAVLSEEELLRILEVQRQRAVASEEYVKALEIDRLTNGNRQDLAGLVERMAIRDVAAGYDIRSFEVDGTDRFIEVKSSSGTQIRFFLSTNEHRFLQEHDSTAWIYFVPRVHELPSLTLPIVVIPNPVTWIWECAVVETHDYHVEFLGAVEGDSYDNGRTIWLPGRGDSTLPQLPAIR